MQIVRKTILGVMFLATLSLSITSCSEIEEESEYDNWEARNTAYIDSIAKVCEKNADGTWTRYCAYTLDENTESKSPNNNHYIYVQKLESGDGDYNPVYKDSIRVHYLGRIIPTASYPQGYVFGKSYSTYTFNEATDVPALFNLGSNVVGFATATMHMVQGDHWRVYIPYYLGYGTTDKTDAGIPGYSTLIFDIKLARIYKYLIDTDTSWH